jgi:hypothetical protein
MLPHGASYAAPAPGSGLWYWPVGTENFQGWDGWLAPRGAYVHVAQDMPSPVGHPVYAIASGVVRISRADTGGYGPGGTPGGCMIIVHTTAAGAKFRALYGHISGLRFKAGQIVAAGAVIATINGCAHLHFSIHPSTTYRDGNPYAGHVPKSWADHGGFVDPVAYLKTHPRLVAYKPPLLPLVSITTENAPAGAGAAAGMAYWNEQTAGGLVTYRYDLATGTRGQLAPGDIVPAFDEARYVIAPLAAPAVGFSVGDRLPVLQVSPAHPTPSWGTAAHLSAKLENATNKVFVGAAVRLERSKGTSWTAVAIKRTASGGTVSFAYTPAIRTTLRLRFAPPGTQPPKASYLGVQSQTIILTPHVSLTRPALPGTVARGKGVTVSGVMRPRHAAGSRTVQLVFQRLVNGTWTAVSHLNTVISDCAAGSRFGRNVRFDAKGSWRVRARHPDDSVHANTVSAWRSFAVQ